MTTLLVASTGGHLKQLHHLHTRFTDIGGPYRWATFDTPQSRSLLEEESVDFVPFVGGRDPVNVVRNLFSAHRVLSDHPVEAVISTGSAVALPFFLVARVRGVQCHYVESAARIDGPSLTGRLMRAIPGVHRYAQYPEWANGRWGFGGSVFESFVSAEAPTRKPIAKAVVTLGTYRGYSFPRLVHRLLQVLPEDVEVLWQTGDTDVSSLGITGHYAMPERELSEAMREADVVIAHAGVGTALSAFEAGKCPVLVPRRLSRGEHVDDHQIQIAQELAKRGLSHSVDADELTFEDLVAASGRVVSRPESSPIFKTVATPGASGSA